MPLNMSDQMYCSQQILIPPNLPFILKAYAKAAIRTQPRDLLLWSLHYFRAVAEGLPPPVKERVEYPPVETESGLTPGYLKVLLNQIGTVDKVSRSTICDKWEGICLEKKYAELLFKIGNFPEQVDWIKFVALAAGTLEKNLTLTMSLLCDLLTEEPEGGSATIPIETFLSLYRYLAALDCGPSQETISDQGINTSEEISFSTEKEKEKSEVWDDLLKDVGDQKSVLTVGTDDLKEVDSTHGLEVWPDLVPNDLKLIEEQSSLDKSEDVISDTGIAVWNEEQMNQRIEEKEIIVPEGAEEEQVNEEEGNTVTDIEEEPKEITTPSVQVEKVEDAAVPSPEERGEEKPEILEEKLDTQSPEKVEDTGSGALPDVAEADKDVDKKDKEEDVEDEETIISEATEEINEPAEEILPPVATVFEPNPEIILVPSPVASNESICSNEKSIESLTEMEKENSTGQALNLTTSLKDVKIHKADDDFTIDPPDCKPANFWVHIPGIGPPVPLEVVEEVEVYLRQCSTKQSGMVMPRNLRHFLCPPLDGL